MASTKLLEVSAELSQKITEWAPLFVKVSKVINENTFEIVQSERPITSQEHFFDDDLNNTVLTLQDKERIFLQYHRSFRCEMYVHALAIAFKEFSDEGIALLHENDRIADIWIMHVDDFDLSDIPYPRVVNVKDPVSGIAIEALCSYQNINKLYTLDPQVCDKLSHGVPDACLRGAITRQYHPINEQFTAPHWWVAVVVVGERLGVVQSRLVHIDICGAAYDDRAFLKHDDSLVSLQMFTTPDYDLMPAAKLPSIMRASHCDQKFVMTPYTRATHMNWNIRVPLLQPRFIRHMRGYHRKDASAVLVTPLETYLRQTANSMSHNISSWLDIVREIQYRILLTMKRGTVVTIYARRQPQFDRKTGVTGERTSADIRNNLIPVILRGNGVVRVETKFLRLAPCQQYLPYVAFLRKVLEKSETPSPDIPDIGPVLVDEHKAFERELWKHKNMRRAYCALSLGKVIYKFLEDDEFVRGLATLLCKPNDRVLERSQMRFVSDCLRIVDHPKSRDALMILDLLGTGTEKGKKQMGNMAGNGLVVMDENSDFHRLCCHIEERIKVDYELAEVFEMMDRSGLCANIRGQLTYLKMYE